LRDILQIPGAGSSRPLLPLSGPFSRALSGLGRIPSHVTNLSEELELEVKKIFREPWNERKGQVVPQPENLALGNHAVQLDATVLYADLSGSTNLVDSYKAPFAAEIYKTYLACAARIIKDQSGTITAYDGDRVMGVFIGANRDVAAVRSAFKINGAVWDIIKPAQKAQYQNSSFVLKHVIGVDASSLMVSRVGVRNDNDLVWVGRAANYAAKLSSLSDEYTIYITNTVYDRLNDNTKYGQGEHMWKRLTWTAMNDMNIYASTWKFSV